MAVKRKKKLFKVVQVFRMQIEETEKEFSVLLPSVK